MLLRNLINNALCRRTPTTYSYTANYSVSNDDGWADGIVSKWTLTIRPSEIEGDRSFSIEFRYLLDAKYDFDIVRVRDNGDSTVMIEQLGKRPDTLRFFFDDHFKFRGTYKDLSREIMAYVREVETIYPPLK